MGNDAVYPTRQIRVKLVILYQFTNVYYKVIGHKMNHRSLLSCETLLVCAKNFGNH